MHINDFSVFDRRRCESESGFNHPIGGWSPSDWMTATVGELGEAANVMKKLNRVRDGIPGNKETEAELRAQLAEEIADTYCYLDLLATACGVSMQEAVIAKFNKVSERIGYKNTLFNRSI
jgi:NTP pyrophosphatase (non-canonical NTP hydrolase)